MNAKITEEDLVKWADGLLDTARLPEVEKYLEDTPGLREELVSFETVRVALKEHIPDVQEPPYPEFFNSKLLREVMRSEQRQRGSRSTEMGWWGKFRWLIAPVTAGALALAFFAGTQMKSPIGSVAKSSSPTELPTVYLPVSSMQAQVLSDQEHGTTLIVVDGLQALPDDVQQGAVTNNTARGGGDYHLINYQNDFD